MRKLCFVIWNFLAFVADALPSYLPHCDLPASGQSLPSPGNTQMLILSVGSGTGGGCAISGLPALSNPCQGYSVTVTSSMSLAQVLAASAGSLVGGSSKTASCSYHNTKSTSQTYTWTAPATGTTATTFAALCGKRGSVWAAPGESVPVNSTAPQFAGGCPNSGLASGVSLLVSVVACVMWALAIY